MPIDCIYVDHKNHKSRSPGRWFASNIMKITVAYIALNYEIQPIKDCPSNLVIGDVIVPPKNVIINVRRRRILV